MENHYAKEFGFLYHKIDYGKYRTQYYNTLGRLLFMEAVRICFFNVNEM